MQNYSNSGGHGFTPWWQKEKRWKKFFSKKGLKIKPIICKMTEIISFLSKEM
jgi:hypothetical protein